MLGCPGAGSGACTVHLPEDMSGAGGHPPRDTLDTVVCRLQLSLGRPHTDLLPNILDLPECVCAGAGSLWTCESQKMRAPCSGMPLTQHPQTG